MILLVISTALSGKQHNELHVRKFFHAEFFWRLTGLGFKCIFLSECMTLRNTSFYYLYLCFYFHQSFVVINLSLLFNLFILF